MVNAEPVVFAGGGRALLLQVAHPGVGAGVEQHSTYASDPWGRLFRTVDVMMKLSFGSPEVSARQARLLARMHRRVVGTDDLGNRYDAMDPALQLWVWATLVDTAVLLYELVHGALTPDEKDRFYQESKLVAHGCGVPEGGCPATWGEFQAYVERVVAEDLHVNGQLTLGENIGDLGGLGIAYDAWLLAGGDPNGEEVDGLTPAQRFFMGWAQAWRGKRRPEAAQMLLSVDPHSPNEFRCNQIVRNIDAFYGAFDVTEGDALWLAPQERVTIW